MTISILGCGWFGFPLAAGFVARGHRVKGSTTTGSKMQEMRGRGIEPYILNVRYLRAEDLRIIPFFECDILVVAIPPQPAEEYPGMILTIIRVARDLHIPRIVYVSSTSVYGEVNGFVDELSPAMPSSGAGRLILEAENALRAETSLNSICLRFGGLVGPGRHPGCFFKNRREKKPEDPGPIPDGLAPINLIHLEDGLGIATRLIEGPYQNLTINAVSPHHPTRISFYMTAARSANTAPPCFLAEKKHWKTVGSRYVQPLLKYEFAVKDWFGWLAHGCGREGATVVVSRP